MRLWLPQYRGKGAEVFIFSADLQLEAGYIYWHHNQMSTFFDTVFMCILLIFFAFLGICQSFVQLLCRGRRQFCRNDMFGSPPPLAADTGRPPQAFETVQQVSNGHFVLDGNDAQIHL